MSWRALDTKNYAGFDFVPAPELPERQALWKNQVKLLDFISADWMRGAICEPKICIVILIKKSGSCTLQIVEN